jgi:hypothetical protein
LTKSLDKLLIFLNNSFVKHRVIVENRNEEREYYNCRTKHQRHYAVEGVSSGIEVKVKRVKSGTDTQEQVSFIEKANPVIEKHHPVHFYFQLSD